MIVKGQKINDRYQIIRTIGEGGMANVYLAHDIILDRDVAVKVLRGDLANDEKFVRRFQREAMSASSLSHPNIVEMYDVGEDDGNYYIVMEYVEGKTLKSLVKRRGALTLPEVIDIMLQLTSAVTCAHESYIIHRDIKPQNVLIKEDGTVKITDFGIAMALNSAELTQTNSVVGSVHYLPPEQANGLGATIKSDIYSLGILMFELLTGKLPFKGENAVEIAIKQMKEKIPKISDYGQEVPQSIENIVLRACAKNPKNRYDSALDMHDDIEHALDEDKKYMEPLVYRYPEHDDLEETKVLQNIKDANKLNETDVTDDFIEKKKAKPLNIILIVLASIVGVALLTFSIWALIFSKKSDNEVKIPNVTGYTTVDAVNTLKEAGLDVNLEYTYESSTTINEGNVIRTSPQGGILVKDNVQVTLIVSSGDKTFEVKNYVGELYNNIEGKLRAEGINVEFETKEITDGSVENNTILEQDILSGTMIKKGDTITFTVADTSVEYPDFVKEQWSLEQIQQFCDDNGVKLTIKYQETSSFSDGTVLSQSREAGTVINNPTTITVTISKEPAQVEEPPIPGTPEDNVGDDINADNNAATIEGNN
ncbi:MAG: Stk1 family PASTA domain-containing Ser/Thr kinase [Clostridium sp.]|nr:Stk1 family PASTA domain-containing Ser/Thr kinase [Clostridium sp.]MCM1444642.1 Stk1 family PASTA domain-containing Ser/Thr kinase [Candidatus Amulumruptor caecigallinarius]